MTSYLRIPNCEVPDEIRQAFQTIAGRYIDWTGATVDFLTTGDITGATITATTTFVGPGVTSGVDPGHSHTESPKLAVDVAATADFLGANNNDGVLHTSHNISFGGLSWTDYGDYCEIALSYAKMQSDDIATGGWGYWDTIPFGEYATGLVKKCTFQNFESKLTIGNMVGETNYVLVDGTRTMTETRSAGGFIKTGWPKVPGVTLAFDDGNMRLTVTDGGSAHYYINGVKYTLGGNKTVDITDTEGIWFLYFSGATLTASQTPWAITDDDKALVAYVYWDATNNKALFLGNELHGYVMDAATHSYLHHTGGAQWDDGLAVSDAGSEDINVSAGDLHDEDLEVDISDGAGAGTFEQVLSPAEIPVLYRDGASNWRIYDVGDKKTATDAGYVDGGNDLHYNKLNGTWASTAVSGPNKYVAYWVVALNAQDTPVMTIMGQRVDNTSSDAEENNIFSGLVLTGAPYQEMIVLARVILKSTAGSPYYEIDSILDLRATNFTGTVITPVISDHGGLTGLADDDHTQYLLADGTRNLTGNMAVDGGVTIDGRDISVDGAALDTVVSFSTTAVKVYLSGDQTVATGAGEVVEFDSEVFDPGNNFNTGTYRYTVPSTGYYLISINFRMVPGVDEWAAGWARKGVDAADRLTYCAGAATDTQTWVRPSASSVEYLTTGEYVEMFVVHSTAGNEDIVSNVYFTNMSIARIG
ncbi:MAG: hypothetical protein GY906_23980 [bacterium]|nr:hypothetical protein [bacterium]